MRIKVTKIVLLVVLGLPLAFIGCTKEKAAEAPKEESVAKSLAPPPSIPGVRGQCRYVTRLTDEERTLGTHSSVRLIDPPVQ